MSSLRYCYEQLEKDPSAMRLDGIIDKTYNDIIDECRLGRVTDDNAVIGVILSLMERIFPRILEAYKDDPDEYESRCLATATAIRVTIGSFMPISKFMEIMNKPDMAVIDDIVNEIAERGFSEIREDTLVNTFKGMKGIKSKEPDIYG